MTDSAINPFIARFAGQPVLIEASAGERVQACLEGMAAHPAAKIVLSGAPAPSDDSFWTEIEGEWGQILRPYVVKDGVLQVPVKGILLHEFPYSLFNWATGYIYIQKAFERGMADANVKAIALIVDSPGGMVAGCFDAVDKMVAAKSKPVRAFAHESAYSAAYAVCMVADHIAVSRTGGVGSIGVVTSHFDYSEQFKQRGIKITFIHAGKHKVDGNHAEPLPDDVKERIQARIDELYQVFVSAVARGRDMDEQAVRDTEALTFTATQAVSNGLADSIGSLDDAVAAFAAVLDDQSDNQGEDAMADEATQSAVDQAAQEAAITQAREEGRAAGLAEGATAERARIDAILGSDEAKDRPALASHFAMKTAMSPEDAKAALAAQPVVVAAPAAKDDATGFDAAMDGPEVGANAGNGDADNDDGAEVLALARATGLKGFVAKSQS